MTMSNTQSARISASAAGASGKAENARAAALAAAETGSPSPAQAFRLAARPFGSTARSSARRRGGEPAGVEAGRAGGEVAPQLKELRRGWAGVADGEAQIAQRAFVGVEAQDFGRGRGADEGEALAQRAGAKADRGAGSASSRARPAPAEKSGSPCPALPLARAQAGTARRRRKGWRFWGFRRGPARPRAPPRRRGKALAEVGERVGNEGEIGANHRAHDEFVAALCHLFEREIRPACRGCGDVR